MKKQRYTFLFFAIIIIVFIALRYWFNESNWNPLDYARITAVDYTAEVVDEPGGAGKVLITERLTFDIHAASKNNLFWELWRDLPEEYIDGVKTGYRVNSVKQILGNGEEVVYQESPKLYWDDYDYINTAGGLGPGKWYYSEGPYSESRRQYECLLLYVDGLYREEVIFEIEYEMDNAGLRYNDASELYLTPYSESSINFLKSFKGQILFPDEIMPAAGNYEAYTYGTDFHTFPLTESDTINPGYHTFSFALDESWLQFSPYNQYLEFSLISYGDDKHIFTENASVNDYYYDDVLTELREEQAKYEALPETARTRKLIVLSGCLAGLCLLVVITLNTDKRMKKKYRFYTSSITIDSYRDIPDKLDPVFAAVLVSCRHKPSDTMEDGYAAVMLSLAHKGYIQLVQIVPGPDWNSGNVKILVTYRPPLADVNPESNIPAYEPLTLSEEQYFNLIMRHSGGTEVTMTSFQQKVSSDFEYTNSFVRNIDNAVTTIGISQGYFQKADYQEPRKQLHKQSIMLGIIGLLLVTIVNIIISRTRLDLAFGGFFILGIGYMISALYVHRLSEKYILLTQYGEDEYARWRGLYNYLNSDALMKERSVTDLRVWEQYLIYATAFGVAEKVIKALYINCPDVKMSPVLRNPYYRSRRFRTSGRSFRSAARTASFSSRSGSFSGGYGGGGRGGGGGGGGH